MYIRKIVRSWVTSEGEKKSKTYYYWYKSKRIGDTVISECVGPATEQEYIKTKVEITEGNNLINPNSATEIGELS
ncbi:MAG: hypothetical protein OEY49_18135 [Candidatus Heimdallarchaeota archaeon]|nr:hypothetical protein [Candidatus Heimdallarchaeota archaeon]